MEIYFDVIFPSWPGQSNILRFTIAKKLWQIIDGVYEVKKNGTQGQQITFKCEDTEKFTKGLNTIAVVMFG